MAWAYATIKTRIQSILQDAGGDIFDQGATDGEVFYYMRDILREIARFVPHIVRVIYHIESRTGTATADSASHLVDTTESQFLEADIGKVVYNSDDKKYAVITDWTSTSDITLSKDIFPDGNESYAIYNKNCHSNKQINVGDVTDSLWVDDLEYPIGTKRQVDSIDGDILTIGIDIEPDDSDTDDTDSDVEVHIYFNKRHKLSQLTDLTWAVNLEAGYDEGATSMAIDTASTSSTTIEEGQEFTIQYRKEIYTITADATIATNATTISFYPGLEADVDDNDVITLKSSTLTPEVENIFCEYVAAKILISKATKPLHQIMNSVSVLTTASTAIGNMSARINDAVLDLVEGRASMDNVTEIITQAEDAISNVNREIDLAFADLNTGRAEIESMSPFGDVSNRYNEYARGGVATARGFLDEAQGHFGQARASESAASTHGVLGARALSLAATDLNQAGGYFRDIASRLSIANNWSHLQNKGLSDLARIKSDLSRMSRSKAGVNHPRT